MTDDFDVRMMQAEWLHDSGELEQALDVWTDCLAVRPDSWQARLGRARTWLQMQQPAAAAIDLRKVLEVGDNEDVRALLLQCEARVGRTLESGDAAVTPNGPPPIPAILPPRPAPPPREVMAAAPRVSPPGPRPARLDAVAGQADLVSELHEVIADWKKRHGTGVWGVGLLGPYGTGRRYLSQCIAAEIDAEWLEADAATVAMGMVRSVQALTVKIAESTKTVVLFIESPELMGKSDRALLGMLTHALRKRPAMLVTSSAEPWLWDSAMKRTLGLHRLVLVPPPDEAARRWFLQDPDPRSPYQAEVDVLVARTAGFTVDDIRELMGPAFPLEPHVHAIDHYLDDREYTFTPAWLLKKLPTVAASGPRWIRRALAQHLDEKLPELAPALHALTDAIEEV